MSAVVIEAHIELGQYALRNEALSEAAMTARRAASALVAETAWSRSLSGGKGVALSEIHQLALECGEADWGEQGYRPISKATVRMAESFVRALPADLPMPEFSPDPDGSISLDWSRSRHHLVIVSVSEDDRMPFVWVDGTDRLRGVLRFDGEHVPDVLVDRIRSVFSNAAAVAA